MSVYPGSIDTFRTPANLPGKTYDPTKTTTIFAEDFSERSDAIVAIETTLGVNPQGANTDLADRLLALETRIQNAHPVGSCYINFTGTDPFIELGFGTWVQHQDMFLVAAGSTYTGTGGSATHTHPLSDNGQAQIVLAASVPAYRARRIASANWTSNFKANSTVGAGTGDSTVNALATALMGATDSASNIPPYMAVYVWERVL